MRLSPAGIAAARELARRRPVPIPATQRAAVVAESIRAWFHPRQRSLLTSVATWIATCKTRRAGATSGGVRELIARALEKPGFRATYISKTSVDARDRAWTNDNKSGFLDVIRELGDSVKLKRRKLEAYKLGGIIIEVRDAKMKLDFSNGSQLEIFGANNIGRHSSKRGSAKNVFWIDEAQDFPGLDEFIAVISPSLRDFGGQCWLTGTPGRDCAGLFYEVTKEEVEERPAGWEVHTISIVDNPFFGHVVDHTGPEGEIEYLVEDNLGRRTGPYYDIDDAERAAVQVRWDVTAGAEKREKNLKGDEADFVREWLGRWVKADARYVYPVHAVPRHQLLFAPQRLRDNPFVGSDPRFDLHPPWYDHHAAVRDLPRLGRDRRPHKWLYSLWFDFGFHPDPFACVMWAFTPTLHDVYEMFSWKMTEVHADDQARYIKLIWDAVSEIVSFGGDAAGKQADFAEWQRRLNLPLEEANKAGKNTLEELLAGDVRRGLVHLRENSPLHTEMRHLVYLPTKPGKTREVHKHRKVNGVVHGDHCCFVAGTMIETSIGVIAIEDMRPGMLVPVRSGEQRMVTAAFSVGVKPLWQLESSDGAILVGTGDHPIWTQRGWMAMRDLMPADTLITWESTDPARSPRSTDVGTGDIQNPSTGPRASTSCAPSNEEDEATRSCFIEPFGNTPSALSQTGSTSTTSTRIRSITPSTTSPSSPAVSTCESTRGRPSGSRGHVGASPEPSLRRPHGTGATLVERGTSSMDDASWTSAPCSPLDVDNAVANSRPSSPSLGSVATPASRPRDVLAASTTPCESAVHAASDSPQIATVIRCAAPTRVLRISDIGRNERVYNLTVAVDHEYFANGILVSNCDASRYGFSSLTHYLAKLPGDRPLPGSRAALEAEAETIEQRLDAAEERRQERLAEADELAGEYAASGEYQWE